MMPRPSGTRGRSFHECGPAAACCQGAKARDPQALKSKVVHSWAGHLREPRRRTLQPMRSDGGPHVVEDLPGAERSDSWRHRRCQWHRDPEDTLTDINGPQYTQHSHDTTAWKKGHAGFVSRRDLPLEGSSGHSPASQVVLVPPRLSCFFPFCALRRLVLVFLWVLCFAPLCTVR